jgi:hypothetical protein
MGLPAAEDVSTIVYHPAGIQFAAAKAISEYMSKAGIEGGPHESGARPGAAAPSSFGERPMSEASMYQVVAGYPKGCPALSRRAKPSSALTRLGPPP